MLDFPALGEGEIDLASILRDLAGSGFSGPVSMEIEFTDYEYPPWEECVEAARRGKRYWDSLDVATATAWRRRLVTTFDIASYVRDLPLYDVHEHHMPETLHDREVGLLKLLEQSYAGWTQARPYPLSPDDEPFSLPPERPCTWEDVARYVDGSGSNAFVTSLVSALSELYGLSDDGITEDSWEELDHEIRRRHADPGWVDDVIARAGDRADRHRPLLERPPRRSRRASARATDRWPESTASLSAGIPIPTTTTATPPTRSPRRSMRRSTPSTTTSPSSSGSSTRSPTAARSRSRAHSPTTAICASTSPTRGSRAAPSESDVLRPTEQKAFGDFVVDRLCALAGERGLPVQMHLGTALIRGSHPMYVAGLVERHPGTRFLLMHLGYPWSRDLLGMAFVYRNIWLDLTWSFLLSPSHFKLALHEAIEILPDESRLMLGGDAWHVEESYGALALGRRLIGEVLHERLQARFLNEEGSRRLARRILHENARAFFGHDENRGRSNAKRKTSVSEVFREADEGNSAAD